MSRYIIRNANVVNEGKIFPSDVLLHNGRIEKVAPRIDVQGAYDEIDAEGKYLIPGIIDDQVHFREPGYTHKGEIYTEAKAAVAGGITSFMEMPNTNPAAATIELLEEKYAIASVKSLANYSFFMGTSNTNIEEIKKVNPQTICGIKIFMGSSTGNLVVDNEDALENIFKYSPTIIATHCETDSMVKANAEKFRKEYGDAIPMKYHPVIRNEENCYLSSQKAIALAKKHDARLHILHISTEEEIALFDNKTPLEKKQITAEACVHHLWFTADDYENLGGLIKCNPAIKDKRHKPKLFDALLDNHFDIIATDHAPHTWEEKHSVTPDGRPDYFKIPSGLPLVQHSLNVMLMFYHQGKISLERVVEKMCHAPAQCFNVAERGYIREGYYADLVLVDLNKEWAVTKEGLHYKCGWSPFEGNTFKGKVEEVFVNGNHTYSQGVFDESVGGLRLGFDRK